MSFCWHIGLPGSSVVKNSPASAGDIRDMGLIAGSGRSPGGGGHGNPLQYSCLENPMDRGAWWAELLAYTPGQVRFCLLESRETLRRVLPSSI